jgi:hypothetical protein
MAMISQSLSGSSQPTPPSRSTSLKRRSNKRDSKRDSKLASLAAPINGVPASTNVSSSSNSNSMHDDDDIVYVVRKHIISRRVPMETATDIVSFEDLPEEARLRPTDTLTWARQTPDYLYLETIVPPQCKVCLAKLQGNLIQPEPIQAIAPLREPEGEMLHAAPTILQAKSTVNAPFYYNEKEQVNAPNNYDEGQTPFVDSVEDLPTSPGGDMAYRNQYYSNNNSNAATPALLIPGNFNWAS